MKMYLISDNVDTHTGMRLSGVDGCVLHTEEELKRKLAEVLDLPDLGILLITEKLAQDFPSVIDDFRAEHRQPLIVQIPDRHGMRRGANFLTAYTGEAIGIKK